MSIIINWRTERLTSDCAEYLLSISDNGKMVLLDNESTESSWNFLNERLGERVYLVRSISNLGYAAGINLALKRAMELAPTHIFIFNNDIKPQTDFFSQMQRQALAGNFDLMGPIVKTNEDIDFSGAKWPQLLFANGLKVQKRPYQSAYVEGSVMLFPIDFAKERINQCGHFFDPRFFMYCEDADLGIWANKVGRSVRILPDISVSHEKSASLGLRSPIKFYYLTRNRILLAKKHLGLLKVPFYIFFAVSRVMMVLLRYTFQSRVQRAIINGLADGFSRRFGKWESH